MSFQADQPVLPAENPLEQYCRILDELPVQQRISDALKAASGLVEYAAYEMARDGCSKDVATLILLAADLERRAVQIKSPLS